MDSLVGVILSAGKGSRIDPFNTHYPKPLLPVGNIPILGHHIARLKAVGIHDVKIVVGHLMEHIINHFGRGSDSGVAIQYVEQHQTLGIAHAVARVEPHVNGPILLCLGDIFYLTSGLDRMVSRYGRGDVAAVIAVMEDDDPASLRKNFSVETDDAGFVRRVVEKPRRATTALKGCGIYLFGPEVFDAIHKTPRTALRDEYEITTTLQIMIDDGLKVAAEPVVDWDLNITFPRDLLAANVHYLAHVEQDNLVAPSAKVHRGATLVRSVIGDDVVIDAPVRIEDSVVLPGSRISGPDDLKKTIVSREIVIRC
jgi:NDP-sugar pyrophosphorylase family protein